MKLNANNLGAVQHAELDVGNLTIIAGENSSGKSQLTYSLWKLLKKSRNMRSNYKHDILTKKFNAYLKDLGSESQVKFTNNTLIKLKKDEYQDIIQYLLTIIKDDLTLNKTDIEELFHVQGADNTFDKCNVNLDIDTSIMNAPNLSSYISSEDYSIDMAQLLEGYSFANNKWIVPVGTLSIRLNKELKTSEFVSYLIDRLLSDLEKNIKATTLFQDVHFATTERIGAFTFGVAEFTKIAQKYRELSVNTNSWTIKKVIGMLFSKNFSILVPCYLLCAILLILISQTIGLSQNHIDTICLAVVCVVGWLISILTLTLIIKNYKPLQILSLGIETNFSSSYSEPVYSNLEFTQGLSIITEQSSFIQKEHPHIIEALEKLMGGSLEYQQTKGIYFKSSSNEESKMIPYRLLSSSIRSLAYIYFYIKHQVTEGSLFIIDEPEAYLHPENQKIMSHVIVMLMNVGVNILITTHSDFMVREINNLIALKRMQELNHKIDSEIYEKYRHCLPNLNTKKISINFMVKKGEKYELENSNVRNSGAEVESFNNTIDEQIEVMEYLASNFKEIEDEFKGAKLKVSN